MSAANASPAVLSRPSAASRFAPLSRAKARAILAPCKPLKLLSKLIGEQKAFDARQARTHAAAADISSLVAAIQSKAEREEWSQRELVQHSGLSARSWRRVCRGAVNPSEWLSKLRTAAARLHLNCNEGIPHE